MKAANFKNWTWDAHDRDNAEKLLLSYFHEDSSAEVFDHSFPKNIKILKVQHVFKYARFWARIDYSFEGRLRTYLMLPFSDSELLKSKVSASKILSEHLEIKN